MNRVFRTTLLALALLLFPVPAPAGEGEGEGDEAFTHAGDVVSPWVSYGPQGK